jgi:hypothetical protein
MVEIFIKFKNGYFMNCYLLRMLKRFIIEKSFLWIEIIIFIEGKYRDIKKLSLFYLFIYELFILNEYI